MINIAVIHRLRKNFNDFARQPHYNINFIPVSCTEDARGLQFQAYVKLSDCRDLINVDEITEQVKLRIK